MDCTNPGFLNRNNQIQDQLTWMHGTHSLKFGADIRRVDWEEMIAPASLFGAVDFTGALHRVAARPSLRRFPARLPNTASRAFPPIAVAAAALDLRLLRAGRLEDHAQSDAQPRTAVRPPSRLGRAARPAGVLRRPERTIVVADDGADKISPLMPIRLRRVVYREQRRAALADAGTDRSQQLRAAARSRVSSVRRRADRDPCRLRPLLRHDADRSPGRARAVRVHRRPRSRIRHAPSGRPAGGVSRGGHVRTVDDRAAAGGQSGSAAALHHQWNVTAEHERWNTGFRVSYVRTLGRDDAVHARRQRAGAG